MACCVLSEKSGQCSVGDAEFRWIGLVWAGGGLVEKVLSFPFFFVLFHDDDTTERHLATYWPWASFFFCSLGFSHTYRVIRRGPLLLGLVFSLRLLSPDIIITIPWYT